MGITCPTKLFYKENDEYGSDEKQNEYLTALAEGGALVEHIVRKFFPDGILVTANSTEEAAANTKKFLEAERICLFEPTFITKDGLLARADILIKNDNHIELIEVKSKSINPAKDSILNKRNKKQMKLSEKFKTYVLDIAFQAHVFKECHPEFTVTPYLCFLDKTKKNIINNLLSSFSLQYKDGHINVLNNSQLVVYPPIKEAFVSLLDLTNDNLLQKLFNGNISFDSLMETDFNGNLKVLFDLWRKNDKFTPKVGAQCKQCEFRTFNGKKSGFFECWSTTKGLTFEQCQEPFCFDLWQCSKVTSNNLIDQGKFLIKDLSDGDLNGAYSSRQSIIIDKIKSNDIDEEINLNLRSRLNDLKLPLHFIDFEIARLPIPTCLGMKPYQLIPFQFSIHHINSENHITHKQYINLDKGNLPILDFIDSLIQYLEIDEGKIIHYSPFEASVLNEIVTFLSYSDADNDSRINSIEKIISRCVDLQKIIVDNYYHPKTLGSNSIKDVLPAILSTSQFLKSKYANEIYGYEKNINSLNFSSIAWIQSNQNGHIKDPYSLLPPLLKGFGNEEVEKYGEDEEVRNHGGAAMLAYSRAQYFDIDQTEMNRLKDALLKYCELDTFAMVMIWEHLNSVANTTKNS